MVRKAEKSDIPQIIEIVKSEPNMDASDNTFSEEYFKEILSHHILLVEEHDEEIVGLCFGKYSEEQEWADILGLVVLEKYRGQGIGTELTNTFEELLPKGIHSIDLYATPSEAKFFEKQGYERSRTYIAYRKTI